MNSHNKDWLFNKRRSSKRYKGSKESKSINRIVNQAIFLRKLKLKFTHRRKLKRRVRSTWNHRKKDNSKGTKERGRRKIMRFLSRSMSNRFNLQAVKINWTKRIIRHTLEILTKVAVIKNQILFIEMATIYPNSQSNLPRIFDKYFIDRAYFSFILFWNIRNSKV